MPAPLSDDDVSRMIDETISALGAKDIKGRGILYLHIYSILCSPSIYKSFSSYG